MRANTIPGSVLYLTYNSLASWSCKLSRFCRLLRSK